MTVMSHRRALAERVLLLRVKAGLTVQQAAKVAGVSRTTWTEIESGDTPVRAETLGRVAAVLGVDVAELLVVAGMISPQTQTEGRPLEDRIAALELVVEQLLDRELDADARRARDDPATPAGQPSGGFDP